MEEEIDIPPTEDDLIGLNGAYTQSIAILHHGLNEMSRELAKIQLDAGNGVEVNGEFPSFVLSSPKKDKDRVEVAPKLDYQLQPKFGPNGIRFVPYNVYGYGSVGEVVEIMPMIGGAPISDDPPPTLSVEAGGAILYFKHTFTWNGDDTVTTESIEIVQSAFGVPVTNVLQVSGGIGSTPVSGNITYLMFSAYNENRKIVADMLGEFWAGSFSQPLRTVTQYAPLSFIYPSATFGP